MSTSSLYWSTSERNCKLSHFRTSVVLQNTWFRLVFKLSLELTRTCCSHIVSMTTHSWPTVWETSCFIQHKSLEQVDWWFVSFLPFYASVITATAIWVTLKVTYLNCGLKRSSKCVILVDFQRYLCHGLCHGIFTDWSLVTGTTWKIQAWTGLEPWHLRCRCSALPYELSGQLGVGHYVGQEPMTRSMQLPY